MKKILAIAFIAGLLLASSCVQRTCPTYSKEVKEMETTRKS
ncbi:MAG: hypothetical protein ACNS62_16340 [Candidatus Cyclobacteriaceae bacterium M3_2C_046]